MEVFITKNTFELLPANIIQKSTKPTGSTKDGNDKNQDLFPTLRTVLYVLLSYEISLFKRLKRIIQRVE